MNLDYQESISFNGAKKYVIAFNVDFVTLDHFLKDHEKEVNDITDISKYSDDECFDNLMRFISKGLSNFNYTLLDTVNNIPKISVVSTKTKKREKKSVRRNS
jgi:hypothetical protein